MPHSHERSPLKKAQLAADCQGAHLTKVPLWAGFGGSASFSAVQVCVAEKRPTKDHIVWLGPGCGMLGRPGPVARSEVSRNAEPSRSTQALSVVTVAARTDSEYFYHLPWCSLSSQGYLVVGATLVHAKAHSLCCTALKVQPTFVTGERSFCFSISLRAQHHRRAALDPF